MVGGFRDVSMLQASHRRGYRTSNGWQFSSTDPDAREVWSRITCLEFAYRRAPRNMNRFVMAVVLLRFSLGTCSPPWSINSSKRDDPGIWWPASDPEELKSGASPCGIWLSRKCWNPAGGIGRATIARRRTGRIAAYDDIVPQRSAEGERSRCPKPRPIFEERRKRSKRLYFRGRIRMEIFFGLEKMTVC